MTTSMTRRGLVGPLAVAAIATSGLAALTSGAFFTDSDTVTGNQFTTGTVKLSTTPVSAAVSLGNMAPGDMKVGTVTIANAGSLAARYSMVSTADNADGKGLAAALSTTVKVGVTDCTPAGFDASGTVLYGPGAFGSATGTKVFGDATQGQQTGDRVLSAGANENLCIQAVLPTSAGNDLQNATTTASFKFDSEQVVNNP